MKARKSLKFLLVSLFFFGGFLIVTKAQAESTIVGIYGAKDKLIQAFSNITPGSSVAIGDIDKDGVEEIVIGSAPGEQTRVRIFEQNGKQIREFFPFPQNDRRTGINVAVGNSTGNGNYEIILVPKRGASAQVYRFAPSGKQLAPPFYVYMPSFIGGATIATGDINGDGKDEIITGAGQGSTHVAVSSYTGKRLLNIVPYGPVDGRPAPWGVVVDAVDFDGNGKDEIVVAPLENTEANIKVFRSKTQIAEIKRAFNGFKGGVSLSTNESGGGARVLLGAGPGGGPHVLQYNLKTGKPDGVSQFPFPLSSRQGVNVAFLKYDGQVKYFAIPAQPSASYSTINERSKTVIVDLSEQRLYAYENGGQVNTFLVSTGLPGMDTHVGTFAISAKIYSKLYAGPGYYLPNTLYNMRFDGPRYLHGAYWHNDFGRRKSHGCVNIAYPNAEWLYNWAPVGTKVIVRQ